MRKRKPSQFPALMQLAYRVGGVEAVIGIAQKFGGKNVYIPKSASDGHPLVVAAGRAAADAVMSEFGGAHYDVPLGISPRNAIAVEVLNKKGTLNDAAGAAGITRRTASRIREQLKNGTAKTWLPSKTPWKRHVDERQMDIDDILNSK